MSVSVFKGILELSEEGITASFSCFIDASGLTGNVKATFLIGDRKLVNTEFLTVDVGSFFIVGNWLEVLVLSESEHLLLFVGKFFFIDGVLAFVLYINFLNVIIFEGAPFFLMTGGKSLSERPLED